MVYETISFQMSIDYSEKQFQLSTEKYRVNKLNIYINKNKLYKTHIRFADDYTHPTLLEFTYN